MGTDKRVRIGRWLAGGCGIALALAACIGEIGGSNAPAGPTVQVRVQALFGLASHPLVGTTPLVLELTSPAGRPIQTTTDLPAFWQGSWADVAKEMRGRYPKHRWPDDPASEKPSLRTKRAFGS